MFISRYFKHYMVLPIQKYLDFKSRDSASSIRSTYRRKEIGDYWLGKTLGKGSSGRVKLGVHKVSGEKVAIKIISKAYIAANPALYHTIKREIALMQLMQHPNIVQLLEVIDSPYSQYIYLILEYVQGGELFEYLVVNGRIAEREARRYFQQLVFGLDYCHHHMICHRDLKPENILIDKNRNIKIADFGMASIQNPDTMLKTSCGSPHYASPEIVMGIPYSGAATDQWSCGVILFALLCGYLPFDDHNIGKLLNKVKQAKYVIPGHVSKNARDLIQRLLVFEPENRLTIKSIQSHAWFVDGLLPSPSNPLLPSLQDICKLALNMTEIDHRLVETLEVLWKGLSPKQILNALLDDSYNMQKVTYFLLKRHTNRDKFIKQAPEKMTKYGTRFSTRCVTSRPLSYLYSPSPETLIPTTSYRHKCTDNAVLQLPYHNDRVNVNTLQESSMSTTNQPLPEATLTPDPHSTPIAQCMNLWQNNVRNTAKIKSPRASHRISTPLPRTRLVYDKTAQSPLLINYHKHVNERLGSHKSVSVHPLMDSSCKALGSAPHVTTSHSSHQFPWTPKVCTMTCIGRDEQEVVRKIRQIIKEHMGGSVTEKAKGRNHSQKGEMVWEDQDGEQAHLHFIIDVTVLPDQSGRQNAMQVCFLEQQGRAQSLLDIS
ncbi:kinase-like domain-containing protein [Phycomyces nitens]|nr:kinase-like domain-containing protein [Phycomyces nitens]